MVTIARQERIIDWALLRSEYLAGQTSYRRLSKKYQVSEYAIKTRGKAEEWVKLAQEAQREATARTIQKTADIAAENAVRAQRIKTRLLEKLEALMEEQLRATEERQYDGNNVVAINRLRDLTAAYKDLTGDMPRAEAGEEVLQQAREILGGVESVIE